MFEYNLSHLRTDPKKTRGRFHQVNQGVDFRTEFQRDRDRVIHAASFRRLKHKTQVFISNEGDFYRTRLTHSIEVSQIARSICNALNLDIDLAESIALAHDLGHPPFGHAGEDALNLSMKNYKGFDHNAQTIKILTQLEEKYPEFLGLNLSWETLEGIAKHNGPLIGKYSNKHKKLPLYLEEFNQVYDLKLDEFPSLEAQIASLADDIAYCCHDIEDGIKANLFTLEQLSEDIPDIAQIHQKIFDKYSTLSKDMMMIVVARDLLKKLIFDLIENTVSNIEKLNIKTSQDIRLAPQMTATFSEEVESLIKQIKQFLFKTVYRHYKVNRMTTKAQMIISKLFEYYMETPFCLPNEWGMNAYSADEESRAIIIADFIAGMTDTYAIKEYNSVFNPNDKLLIL